MDMSQKFVEIFKLLNFKINKNLLTYNANFHDKQEKQYIWHYINNGVSILAEVSSCNNYT